MERGRCRNSSVYLLFMENKMFHNCFKNDCHLKRHKHNCSAKHFIELCFSPLFSELVSTVKDQSVHQSD